jgi:hypothetical protein
MLIKRSLYYFENIGIFSSKDRYIFYPRYRVFHQATQLVLTLGV